MARLTRMKSIVPIESRKAVSMTNMVYFVKIIISRATFYAISRFISDALGTILVIALVPIIIVANQSLWFYDGRVENHENKREG
jgi:hypothetical protein